LLCTALIEDSDNFEKPDKSPGAAEEIDVNPDGFLSIFVGLDFELEDDDEDDEDDEDDDTKK